jgi:glycosyltransferase involved in cell wall biosynthesis
MLNSSEPLPTPLVVVPTYNNRDTIGRVVGEILLITPHVLVVDDGSDDGAPAILASLPGLRVVRHARNLGKGAALKSGWLAAAQLGYSHVACMDGDGQHLSGDLPRFFQEISAHPDALVLGRRLLAGGKRAVKSRLLRAHSNFWVAVLTGRWVGDSQSGFRAYPLKQVLALKLTTRKYDFEVEVLVKALWTGAPVREIPIDAAYGPGSVSHFRPFRDFMLVFRLISTLLWSKLTTRPSVLKRNCLAAECRERQQ